AARTPRVGRLPRQQPPRAETCGDSGRGAEPPRVRHPPPARACPPLSPRSHHRSSSRSSAPHEFPHIIGRLVPAGPPFPPAAPNPTRNCTAGDPHRKLALEVH